MAAKTGIASSFSDAFLFAGVRTPFADYNGALAQVSPIDLGIKAARALFERSGASPDDVGTVITGSMAQASFDAYMLPPMSACIRACRSKPRRIMCSASAAPASKC